MLTRRIVSFLCSFSFFALFPFSVDDLSWLCIGRSFRLLSLLRRRSFSSLLFPSPRKLLSFAAFFSPLHAGGFLRLLSFPHRRCALPFYASLWSVFSLLIFPHLLSHRWFISPPSNQLFHVIVAVVDCRVSSLFSTLPCYRCCCWLSRVSSLFSTLPCYRCYCWLSRVSSLFSTLPCYRCCCWLSRAFSRVCHRPIATTMDTCVAIMDTCVAIMNTCVI